MEKKEKQTFREWAENIWYYYKWLVLFIGLMIVFAVICIVQLAQKDEPDVDVMFVGPGYYLDQASKDNLGDSFELISEDYNGDGKFTLNLLDITMPQLETSEGKINVDQYNTGLKRFEAEIRTSDAAIYILDREYFNKCMELSLLTPISDVIDDAYLPGNIIEGCGITLSELDIYSLPGFDRFPEDAILCLRRSPEKDAIDYGKSASAWDGNRRSFVAAVKYKKGSK